MIEATLEHAQNEVDRLTAWPEVVDVMHTNEFAFLEEIRHWCVKGYRFSEHSLQSFDRGDYYVLMFAPSGWRQQN